MFGQPYPHSEVVWVVSPGVREQFWNGTQIEKARVKGWHMFAPSVEHVLSICSNLIRATVKRKTHTQYTDTS